MSSTFDLLAFDADDTLWHNESRYQAAKSEFVHLMSSFQPPERASALLDEIELRNLSLYGYGMKSFTLSMIETALALSDGKISGAEINAILGIARRVLTAPVELFPKVAETIAQLAKQSPSASLNRQQRCLQNRFSDCTSTTLILSLKDNHHCQRLPLPSLSGAGNVPSCEFATLRDHRTAHPPS